MQFMAASSRDEYENQEFIHNVNCDGSKPAKTIKNISYLHIGKMSM